MSCPYFWYNNHYACRKTGKDVNEDTYDKYCRSYDYGDCPIYKGQDSSGCFLTSACVEAKGLPDDCYELSTLRSFRDGYMRALPCGEEEIEEYYSVAPKIVDAINFMPDAGNIWETIYETLVIPCVRFIEQGKNENAHILYKSVLLALKAEYLN